MPESTGLHRTTKKFSFGHFLEMASALSVELEGPVESAENMSVTGAG